MVGRTRKSTVRHIHCYFCGHALEVSSRAMSTTCSGCHKAIKVEDLVVKSYVPVNDLQTCGKIRVTRRGRVAAKNIQSGDGLLLEGTIEGSVTADGLVKLGPKSTWKGKKLTSEALTIADGATLDGHVQAGPRIAGRRRDAGASRRE